MSIAVSMTVIRKLRSSSTTTSRKLHSLIQRYPHNNRRTKRIRRYQQCWEIPAELATQSHFFRRAYLSLPLATRLHNIEIWRRFRELSP